MQKKLYEQILFIVKYLSAYYLFLQYNISGVMVSVLALSVVDHGF
jgi:hypothetical protein